MKKTTRLLIIIIVATILAIGISLGVYGYFTYKAQVTNNINLGYNKIQIKEQKLITPQRTGFTVVEWGGTEIK